LLPEIRIDETKCTAPLDCRQCLLTCSLRVLSIHPKKYPQKFKELDPGDFKIVPFHQQFCTGCRDCVAVCPQNAIQLNFQGDVS
jgi:ferredoxin